MQSYCEFHLGDNLAHLHFLRAVTRAHPELDIRHHVHACHLAQLREAIERTPIQLLPLEDKPEDAVNVWKNHGGYWERHPRRNNYAAFYLDWFAEQSRLMGIAPVFSRPQDLLFDYPALLKPCPMISPLRNLAAFDFLVVNSRPCSGQYMEYNSPEFMDGLIEELLALGHTVAVTQKTGVGGACWTGDFGLTISGIGALSLSCTHHIMVSTGPSWPTLNIFNKARRDIGLRLILIEREIVNIDPGVECVSTIEAARQRLKESGLL